MCRYLRKYFEYILMAYTSQPIKLISKLNFILSPHFSHLFRGWGRLNLNIELLQMKCSDFRLNLRKLKVHNTCHVSHVGMFFSNLFRFNEMDVINKTAKERLRNGNFQIVVSLLYAHYPMFFFLSSKQYSHTLNSA